MKYLLSAFIFFMAQTISPSVLGTQRSTDRTIHHDLRVELSLTWVAADIPRAVPGLGRKLPHYHKYSYLGFKGEEPVNFLKGRWPVLDSPMTIFINGGGEIITLFHINLQRIAWFYSLHKFHLSGDCAEMLL